MNRRNFFRNLVLGATSAPAIAKALVEEPAITVTEMDCTDMDWPEVSSLQHQLARHFATQNPCGVLFAADQQPMRFQYAQP